MQQYDVVLILLQVEGQGLDELHLTLVQHHSELCSMAIALPFAAGLYELWG